MTSDSNEEGGGHPKATVKAAPDANGMQQAIAMLLENLGRGRAQMDHAPPVPVDSPLILLRDHVALSSAQEGLLLQSKNKSLGVVFQARVSAMVGLINLFLDPQLSYTWREASMIVAKAEGNGSRRARSIRTWTLDFVREGKLPLDSYGYSRETVLDDEDISQEIQDELWKKSKAGYVKAQDICEIVASEKLQGMFLKQGICKPSISLSTAHRWLAKLNWQFGKKKNGMYIDGHERDDVVAYRQAFVHRWADYEMRFHIWDNGGGPLARSPSNLHPLILVTHDESTFFQNDERRTCWNHQDSRPTPKPKGDGQSLMVSDFLTAEWGRLLDGYGYIYIYIFSAHSIDYFTGIAVLCSNQGRTATGTLARCNFLHKSIAQSTSLSARQTASLRASSYSITHPATRSVLMMPSRPPRWSKVRPFFFFLKVFFISLMSLKIRSVSGHISRKGHACAMALIP